MVLVHLLERDVKADLFVELPRVPPTAKERVETVAKRIEV
jgi:hypothetical protein